nr:hypothetical protein [uncultured Campylobacter sp.]
MRGLSGPCQISHVAKSRRNCARYKSSQTRRGNIADKAHRKNRYRATSSANRQCKADSTIDAIRHTADSEQYKTDGVHGRQCKSANVRRATKRLLL